MQLSDFHTMKNLTIATDFRDDGAGLKGDLLHVGGNMAI